MTDHKIDEVRQETAAERFERYEEAVRNDPAARRLSDFATTPPAKDIASIKAASDIFDAAAADRLVEDDGDAKAGDRN